MKLLATKTDCWVYEGIKRITRLTEEHNLFGSGAGNIVSILSCNW